MRLRALARNPWQIHNMYVISPEVVVCGSRLVHAPEQSYGAVESGAKQAWWHEVLRPGPDSHELECQQGAKPRSSVLPSSALS